MFVFLKKTISHEALLDRSCPSPHFAFSYLLVEVDGRRWQVMLGVPCHASIPWQARPSQIHRNLPSQRWLPSLAPGTALSLVQRGTGSKRDAGTFLLGQCLADGSSALQEVLGLHSLAEHPQLLSQTVLAISPNPDPKYY